MPDRVVLSHGWSSVQCWTITGSLLLDLLGLPLGVVCNLGHDVLLTLDTDRHGPAVPDLDLALDLLGHQRPGSSREVGGGVGVDLVLVPGPGDEPAPGGQVVLDLLRGGGVTGTSGAGAGAVYQGPALTEPAGALPAHLAGSPRLVITQVRDVLEVAVGVGLVTAAVLGPVGLSLLSGLLLGVDLPVDVTVGTDSSEDHVTGVHHSTSLQQATSSSSSSSYPRTTLRHLLLPERGGEPGQLGVHGGVVTEVVAHHLVDVVHQLVAVGVEGHHHRLAVLELSPVETGLELGSSHLLGTDGRPLELGALEIICMRICWTKH